MKKTRIVLSRAGASSAMMLANILRAEKEDRSNKVVEQRETPDDEHYPSEKLLFDSLSKINDNKQSIKRLEWGSNNNLNNILDEGVYLISGERLNVNDNMPIANSNPGHTIAARLTLLDSTINPQEQCKTQILELSNRLGGDGNIYIRTAISDALGSLQWKPWQRMQGIVDVGVTASIDAYIDNGMYSGVLLPNYEMFIVVVLNNYSVAGALGCERSVMQLKLSLGVDSVAEFKFRVGRGGNEIVWGDWFPMNYNSSFATDIQNNKKSISNEVLRAISRENAIVEQLNKIAAHIGMNIDI